MLSAASLLVSEYIDFIITNSVIRSLVSLVNIDNVSITRMNIVAQVGHNVNGEPYNRTRHIIKSYLDKVYFSRHSLDIDFWTEMEIRLKKLVSVSLVLERLNIAVIDAHYTPVTKDVPQSLAFIYYYLNSDYYRSKKEEHVSNTEAMVIAYDYELAVLYMGKTANFEPMIGTNDVILP